MSTALSRQSEAARGLMERVLRAGTPIAPEYPLVFSGAPSAAFVLEEEGGVARSACAVLERELVVRGRSLRAGMIGSVATEPRWREQGLGATVLQAAEDELARRGALLAILWADDPEFYEHRGWARFGWEIDFTITSELAAKLPEPFGVRALRDDDHAQLHALYERHPERVARSAEETSALLCCPDMEVLVLERWGRVAAYSCLGRGADLRDVVHEWAGDAQAVLALLREHITRRRERGETQDLYLMVPPSAADLAERLTALGATLAQGVVGMAKILRPREAAELAAKLLDRRNGVQCVEGPGERGEFRLRGPKGEHVCTARELFLLLFAPLAERTTVERIGAALGTPGVELPLTPFVWGLDSI